MVWMNRLKTAVLLAALTGLLVLLGQALGGANGMMVGFIMAVIMNFGSYWFSDRIAMTMAGAREVTPSVGPGLRSGYCSSSGPGRACRRKSRALRGAMTADRRSALASLSDPLSGMRMRSSSVRGTASSPATLIMTPHLERWLVPASA